MPEIVSEGEWDVLPLVYKIGPTHGATAAAIGGARMLRLNPKTGGTELVPVRVVADWEAHQQRGMAELAGLQERAERDGWDG
ncbi:MAG: hypothetical protein ACREN1_07625 [Candidatus Dormibacteria bacterium]